MQDVPVCKMEDASDVEWFVMVHLMVFLCASFGKVIAGLCVQGVMKVCRVCGLGYPYGEC